MVLEILPTRIAGAAENMAVDFLLLQRYPRAATPRFRHYDWRAPAFTFGYSQKIAFVREQLPFGETFDLCRRPTGGGIVDHRNDWTYALVIPRGHPLEEVRATQSYRLIHDALTETLRAQNIAAVTKLSVQDPDDPTTSDSGVTEAGVSSELPTPGGLCFQRAELYDVVHELSGAKIAGAAQKRNKHGLLFQGSISRAAAEGTHRSPIGWDRFEAEFGVALAKALGCTSEPVAWPDLADDEVSGLTEQYSSPEWIERR
jgi:lipoyl(octanoyl) transferase